MAQDCTLLPARVREIVTAIEQADESARIHLRTGDEHERRRDAAVAELLDAP